METAPTSSGWKLARRMIGLALRTPGQCLQVMFLRLLLLLFTLSGLGLTGLGVDIIRYGVGDIAQRPMVEPFHFRIPADWTADLGVLVVAVGILLIAVARGLLFYTAQMSAADLVHRKIVTVLRAQVFDRLQRLSFRFYDANNSGSIINRVTGDCRLVGQFIETVAFQSIDLALTVTLSVCYMFAISPKLTLACLASVPVMVILALVFGHTVKPAYRENRRLVDELILRLAEHVQGIHVVKGFARQPEEVAKFENANHKVRDQAQWIFWRVTVFQPTIGFLSNVNMIVLLGFGGWLTIQGQLPLGAGLIVFAGLLEQFSAQINMMVNITNTIQISLTSAQRVFEILDAPVEIISKPDAVHLPKARGELTFANVSFGYGGSEGVLTDVSFTAAPGQCIALVGATGAGKSTLLSLIPRFYDPTSGHIALDGVDLRDLDVDDLRRNIGLVFQENFLFSATVAANIAFGHPNATRAQVEKAAQVAAAHNFIMELPKGYDTVLTEGGTDLSGGQRQRLAIARAILLEPALLILDDATAAIDPQTEHEILEAMDNAMRGRTTFVVAHRLSTLRRADMVLVLDHGRVVQRGTHEQLMQTKGHYQKAARLQIADPASRRLLGME